MKVHLLVFLNYTYSLIAVYITHVSLSLDKRSTQRNSVFLQRRIRHERNTVVYCGIYHDLLAISLQKEIVYLSYNKKRPYLQTMDEDSISVHRVKLFSAGFTVLHDR